MDRRLQLHERFTAITPNVYFQPPNNLQMLYPCIVYNLEAEDVKFADNGRYSYKKRYLATVIDRDPDSDIPDKLGQLPLTRFARSFTSDNLHHFAYSVYN